MTPRRLASIAVVLALALAPAWGRGEWYDLYQDALQAIDDGDAETAIGLLREALERKPRSGYLRTYGNNYIRYAPHFQLGVAHHEAGDCETALGSFGASKAAGETDDEPAMDARRVALEIDCRTRLAPVPEPQAAAEPQAAPPTAAPGPPPSPVADVDVVVLERGLAAYLDGDFLTAVRLFDELVAVAPDSPRLHLLSGMALHGSWVLDGERSRTLLERAQRRLERAVRLDPGLIPDPALCPPRVAAMLRTLRGS